MTGPAPPGPLSRQDRDVADRFLAAWERCDVPAPAVLLREDAILRMPPEATVIEGRDQIAAFFATVPAGGRLGAPVAVAGRQAVPGQYYARVPVCDGPRCLEVAVHGVASNTLRLIGHA